MGVGVGGGGQIIKFDTFSVQMDLGLIDLGLISLDCLRYQEKIWKEENT